MKWFFIRHGEIASNRRKVYSGRSAEALTDAGIEQAKNAAARLTSLEIDAVYCSPLRRTRQTAQIIVEELGREIPIRIEDSFNEFRMGPWEGMAETEVATQFPEAWKLWHEYPAQLELAGRETLAELQARVLRGIDGIRSDAAAETVLVVTHVAVIRVLDLFTRKQSLNDYKTIRVDNAQVFEFELG